MSFDHRHPGTPEQQWQGSRRLWQSLELDLTGVDRAVVFAAHPDDETLGAGGTVHRLVRQATAVRVIVASMGENSHPDSPTHTPERLSRLRRREMAAAVATLTGAAGGDGRTGEPGASQGVCAPEFLDLPDGALTVETLTAPVREAVAWLSEGERPLAVVTWSEDGHPDHAVLGATVQTEAGAAAVRCIQYPIWWWHWGTPGKLPAGLVRVPLSPEDRRAKREALEHHATQVRALSERPGDEVLLGPHVLEHFMRDTEFFVLATPHQGPVFDRVHTQSADPWNVDTSPYELRKREVLLASLPRRTYAHALDIGCSTGALTARLAERTQSLTAVDASDVALGRARERLAREGVHGVDLRHAVLPDQWDFAWTDLELIVISEVGYFCSPAQWARLLALCTRALSPHGHLVLCHWRHPIEDWPLDGDHVHRHARSRRSLQRLVEHREEDFEIEIFARRERP